MENAARVRPAFFVLAIFVFTFTVQCVLWLSPLPYVDGHMWQEASLSVARGQMPSINGAIAPHPGTTIIVPASLSQFIAPGNSAAFKIAMALLMSLSITAIISLVRAMHPQSLWWIGVAALFVPHALYMDMTPPSALAAVLTALFVLLVMRAETLSGDTLSLALIGVCGGLLLSTRIDMGIVMLAASIPFLYPLAQRRIIYLIGFAALFFAASDPYIWLSPFGQFNAFFLQVHDNVSTKHGVADAYGGTTLAYISFVAAGLFLIRKNHVQKISRSFLLWLMLTAGIFTIAILLQQYLPLRYFFPFIMSFEMLLPLFIATLADEAFSPSTSRKIQLTSIGLFLIVRIAPIAILLT